MATKNLNENPTIADQIIIQILTPSEIISGIALDPDNSIQPECFDADPFKVDNVTIYYVERDFVGRNSGETEITIPDLKLQSELEEAKVVACNSPTDKNLLEIQKLHNELEAASSKETIKYKEAKAAAIFGDGDTFPAWLSTDLDNAILEHVALDDDGATQYGHFNLEWNPVGMREGDYFVCWTWTPLPAGSKFSAHQFFRLGGATQLTTSIPTHFTTPGKYDILMDRYLPEMYKYAISDSDLTKEVLHEFNRSIGDGFVVLEDLANQMVDIIDANATHESLLQLLGNLFNLKLRTDDPTLWRRQIKRAMPLFKQKGTFPGLESAMNQADIKLSKYTDLWQVISPYTYQEHFDVGNADDIDFVLTKAALLPVDVSNFELYHRGPLLTNNWEKLVGPTNYVTLNNSSDVTTMTWIGDQLSIGAITLEKNDSIRVVYEVVNVAGSSEQTLEDYIRTLPISDQRDERDQLYPTKNWNVRLIEGDDALFDLIIPSRHPFVDNLVFGKVRTEFPYSENIYNMEEYNGSKRDSLDPCDIDKGFLDPCMSCQSSKYNVDLEIEDLSNYRLIEAQEILNEFTPFHAVLHSISLTGTQTDFIQSPVELIEALIGINGEETTLVDPPQTIFSRTMTNTSQIKRDELANLTTVVSSASGTGKNKMVTLLSPDFHMDRIPLEDDPTLTYLEVLAPHTHAGTYTIQNPLKNHAEVLGATEPITQSEFTFRLSNEALKKTSSDIYQDDFFAFADDTLIYSDLNVKSQWDVDNDPTYSDGPWQVSISDYSDVYDILKVLPDGTLILSDPSKTLPTVATTGISYELLDDSTTVIESSTVGALAVKRRGRVDMGTAGSILVRGTSTSSTVDLRNLIKSGYTSGETGSDWYALYNGTQYFVNEFVDGETHEFYIDNYTVGDVTGVTVTVYQRIANNELGFFHLKGIQLITGSNHETGLGILNGENAPADENDILENDLFKENFLVLIGSEYFAISDIDGTTITLAGPHNDWNTTGTAVDYDIFKYSKFTGTTVDPPTGYRFDPVADIPERIYPPMPGYKFEFLDRRGNEVIKIDTETGMSMMAMASLLNAGSKDQILETVGQEESITFSVDWKDE